jgi:hypothetical protein
MYFPARAPGTVETKSMKLNFARPLFLLRWVEAMTPPDCRTSHPGYGTYLLCEGISI